MRPKSLHRQSPRTGEVRIECGESLCTGRALAPARPAAHAATRSSTRTGEARFESGRKSLHRQSTLRRRTAAYDGVFFFRKTSHERGALRRRIFFFTTLAAVREATSSTHSHRQPRIRMRMSATRLQAQLRRKATNHALRHFVYLFLPPKQYGYFAAGESHRQARPQCQRITQDSRLDVKSQSYHLHDGRTSSAHVVIARRHRMVKCQHIFPEYRIVPLLRALALR